MYKIKPTLMIKGENFSPKIVEEKTGINFTEKNEVGEKGTRGIYKDKPIPYGFAAFYPPTEAIDPNYYYSGFDWLISKLCNIVEISRTCGADDIYLDLIVLHKFGCSISFEPNALAEIVKANILFCITCYQDDELED